MTSGHYLGDGLYVDHDGYQFILHTKRESGTHYVALEPDVLDAFIRFVEKKLDLNIVITKKEPEISGAI